MNIEIRLLQALWFIVPAYVANSVPVNVSKIKELERFGRPIDGGRKWLGVRILGDGKTWRGLFSGVFMGTLIGLIQILIQRDVAEFFRAPLPQMSIELAFMLSTGALVGDMAASFVKRRAGLKAGGSRPALGSARFRIRRLLFCLAFNANY